MSGRSWICLASALFCAACSTSSRRADLPLVQGGDLEVHLRNTPLLWRADIQRAADTLARQKPQGLDAPLRLALVVRPGVLVDSEISIRFAVDAQGQVADAQVLGATMATGSESIAVATLNTLRMWRFDPPMHDGAATGYCCVRLTIENVAGERPFEPGSR